MFRLGGQSADGVGITSGFNRRRYEGGEFGEQITEEMRKATEKPKFGTDELIAEAYRTVGGASDWKDWIKQGSDRALEIQEERKALPEKNLKLLLDAQKEEAGYYKATRPLEIERMQQFFEEGSQIIQNLGQPGSKYQTWEDFKGSPEFSDWEFKMNTAMRGEWPSRWEVDKRVAAEIAQINENRKDKNYSEWLPGSADYEKAVAAIVARIYSQYLPGLSFGETQQKEPGKGTNAYGGKPRVARQFGNPNPAFTDVNVAEQIQTPTTDINIDENIATEQQPPAGDDPYIMLRARLPQEIPDDVVRLIAYNPEAFADFAEIETQEDVMAFNQKYSVELIVNTDEV